MRKILFSLLLLTSGLSGAPIRLHPDNPHYFEYKGKPLLLVTSAEHYGALINLDFDYRKYLDTLHADGMNYTRLFMGSYIENADSFGIQLNTLGPKENRLIVPWKRSSTPGYINGGNKFDLTQWDSAYFDRLKDFLKRAAERDIIVELTLFCSTYRDSNWENSPLHPNNNINGTVAGNRKLIQTLPTKDNNLLPYQEAYVRKFIQELNECDNFFFEIQNEPWADNEVEVLTLNPYEQKDEKGKWSDYVHVASLPAIAWQRHISKLIAEEESRLPQQHLIAQNYCNFKFGVDQVADEISIMNFHYNEPEAAYWNLSWGRVIGYDESGFKGSGDDFYRKHAWNFLLAGGGLFNNLDYSFVAGYEDGTYENQGAEKSSPGGGSPALRKQLRILKDFIYSFDFIKMEPDRRFAKTSSPATVRGLANPGKQYAVVINGDGPVELNLSIPAGRYRVEWINTKDGSTIKKESVRASSKSLKLSSPAFSQDIALKVTR